MRFERDETQVAIARSTRSLLEASWSLDRIDTMADGAWSPEAWRAARDAGWSQVLVPAEAGGLGLGAVELGAIFEECGRALYPGPLVANAVAAALLADRIDARETTTFALAVSWVAGGIAPAARVADGRVTGEAGAAYADVADALLVCSADGDGPAIAVVDARAAGVRIVREPTLDPIDRPCRIRFEDAPASILGRGPDAVERLAAIGALTWSMTAAEILGTAEALLALSVDHANARTQFGRPIGSFQAVQHRLADMQVMTATLRSACYASQARIAAGSPLAGRAARVAKAYASGVAVAVGEGALQVHGGIAFTVDLPVHLFVKHCLALRALYGDEHAHAGALGADAMRRRSDVSAARPASV